MDNASLIDIKKLFTKHGGVNFFNEFTLLDVIIRNCKYFLYLFYFLANLSIFDITTFENFYLL